MNAQTKARIDSMSYFELLSAWRFAPLGDPLFQGDAGEYFSEVMSRRREEVGPDCHTATSKAVGWDQR